MPGRNFQFRQNLTVFLNIPIVESFILRDFTEFVSLTLKVKDLDYDKIDEVLDPKLREKLTDFRLKKDSSQMNDLLEKLWKPDEEKLQSFWWWQELLKEFLKSKYPEDYTSYESILKELNVLN